MSSPINLADQQNPAVKPSFRNLPAVVFFPGDEIAESAIAGLQRYLRMTFQDFAKGRDSETIIISSLERMIAEKAALLRAPNVRVIAIADRRYHDPRIDGVVYTYLPPGTPSGLLERSIDNAVDHIHLLATRRDVNERLAATTREIHELSAIGAALCAEHDSAKVLQMFLTQSRQFAGADAGLLYLVEKQPESPSVSVPVKSRLRLVLAEYTSLAIPFQETVADIDNTSAPGFVALTGVAVNIEDAYHLPPDVPYVFDRSFDENFGYRTRSVLVVAIRNLKHEVLGVIQLINAKRDSAASLTSPKAVATAVIPFSVRMQEMIICLALQAAVALENSRLLGTVARP